MGNTPEEPDRRLIGHNGQAHVKVNYTVYGMWAYSSSIGSIWEACLDFEAGTEEQHQTGEDLAAATAAEVAGEVARTLPMLIAAGCAFVDVVR